MNAQGAEHDFTTTDALSESFSGLSESLNRVMALAVETEHDLGWLPNNNRFGESLALLHSEVSEALEAYRIRDWGSERDDGKPEGVSSELADVFIRLLSAWAQFVQPHGFDLGDEVERKMRYNRTRSFRHGGKAL